LRNEISQPDILIHLRPANRLALLQRLHEDGRKRREEEEKRIDTEFRRILTRRMDNAPKSPRTRKEAKVESAKPGLIEEDTRRNELEGARILDEMRREQQQEAAPSVGGEPEHPVPILLADLLDFAIQVIVQLPSQNVKVDEVLPALVDQHSSGIATGPDGFPELTGLRLAKMSKWLTFFSADLKAEVGSTRAFFVYGLAKFLGQEFGPEAESHRHLKALRHRIYGYGPPGSGEPHRCVGGG